MSWMRKKKNGRMSRWHSVCDDAIDGVYYAKCGAIFVDDEEPEKAKAPALEDRCLRCKFASQR